MPGGGRWGLVLALLASLLSGCAALPTPSDANPSVDPRPHATSESDGIRLQIWLASKRFHPPEELGVTLEATNTGAEAIVKKDSCDAQAPWSLRLRDMKGDILFAEDPTSSNQSSCQSVFSNQTLPSGQHLGTNLTWDGGYYDAQGGRHNALPGRYWIIGRFLFEREGAAGFAGGSLPVDIM